MVSPKPKLVLADDHRLVRESLSNALKATHEIVASVSDGEELLRTLSSSRADCLLLDLDMPGQNGLSLLPVIRGQCPELRILMVTMHGNGLLAASATLHGADGFVTKDAGVEELTRAIAEVCAGRQFISSGLSRARHHLDLEAAHPMLRRLTPRQQEVLLLLGEGKSASSIAAQLSVGASTVTFHKQNIMRALGLSSQEGLREYAFLVRSAATNGKHLTS
jgi:two-component system nitrate/nitrite response regulator NarL